jgi:dTDP-4-amino-4,6-dideoxygalactose transaminase
MSVPAVRQTDPGAFNRQHRREVIEALERVIDSGWYILGTEVAAFEREFGRELGLNHSIGVANGTDAVSLALRALDIEPGTRVATVSHTAVATVAAIEMAGCKPLFVDIDLATYTMDAGALAATLERSPERVEAVVVVHLYGHPAKMAELLAVANRFDLAVIEDCAQAHGARIGTRHVGSFADAAAFSFYPTKNLGALGDGGLVGVADEHVATRARVLREYGWKERYISHVSGINSRLDELQAAYLRLRLPFLQAGNQRRATIAAAYDRGLAHTGLTLPTQADGTTHVYHQYVVRHPDREGLRARLQQAGIATGVHYPVPVHIQPAYLDPANISASGLEVTEKAAREVLSLPMYPELDYASVAAVIEAVCKAL